MFENWTTDWSPAGYVSACPTSGASCTTASNGQTMSLAQGGSYNIQAMALEPLTTILWTSSAGSISSNISNPTTFTPSQSGVLDLIVTGESNNWAGYVSSPSSNGAVPPSPTGSITSVSADIILPPAVGGAGGIWVGIGGLSSTNLWQAGFAYLQAGGSPVAFYEAVGTGAPDEPYYQWNYTYYASDRVEVTVTSSSSGTDTFSVIDVTHGIRWNGDYPHSWTPTLTAGDWVVEPKSAMGSGPYVFSDLQINGASSGAYSPYLGLEVEVSRGVWLYVSELAVSGSSSPQFTVS